MNIKEKKEKAHDYVRARGKKLLQESVKKRVRDKKKMELIYAYTERFLSVTVVTWIRITALVGLKSHYPFHVSTLVGS